MTTIRLALFLTSFRLFAQAVVEPRIPDETLPAGGGVQIKLELTSPNPIIVGHFEMDSFSFDSFDGVSIFSPTGDAFGVAYRQGSRFVANLVSPQGSLGTQADYPFFVVAANIPSGLAVGTRIPLNIGSATTLTSPGGTPYSIPAPKSGVLTIGGRVSISNLIPGGGLLPPGTEVRLLGTGFDAETRVDVNEVAISNLRVINSNEIRFNVSQAVQMTAKRIRVRDRNGSEAVYYSYLRALPIGSSARPLLSAAYPIFSSNTYTSALLESGAQPQSGFIGVAVSNSSLNPAQVSLTLVSATGAALGQATVGLPAGSRWSRTMEEVFNASGVVGSSVRIVSNTPVHVLGLRGDEATGSVIPFAPGSAPPPPPPPAVRISAAPESLQFSAQQNGPAPAARNVQVVSTGTALAITAAATASWITVSPVSGTTPVQLTLGVNPAGLPVGNHSGAVNLTAANGSTASIPITLSLEAPPSTPLVAAPPSLSFSYEMGAPLPNPRNVQVFSAGGPLTVSVASTAPWLTASPGSGATPFQLSVSVNPTGLPPGNHSGEIVIRPPTGAEIVVPANLTVTAAPVPPLLLSSSAFELVYSPGGPLPDPPPVQVASSGTPLPIRVSSSAPWIEATADRAETPASIRTRLLPVGLSPGTHTGSVTVTPAQGTPRSINIVLQVVPATQDPPAITSIISSTGHAPARGVAPGDLVSIYGTALAGTTRVGAAGADGRFESQLADVRVWIGGTQAPILFVSPRQINVQVPFEQASGGTVGVSVEYRGIRSAARNLTVLPTSAVIFTTDASGRGQAAVLNQDYSRNAVSSPARRGSAIMIFAAGGGTTLPPSSTGSLAGPDPRRTSATVFVLIGGQRVPALYSGTSPGSITGLLQVNAIVPGDIATGATVPLAIEVNGEVSQEGVTISVE